MADQEPQYSTLFRVPMPLKLIITTLIFPFACTYTACIYGIHSARARWGDGKPAPRFGGNYCLATVQIWERQRRLKKDFEQERPPPLPTSPKRSLTIPNVCARASFLKRRKATNDQLRSTFFGRLPFELREMIYMHYLAGSEDLYIYRRTDNRLGHCRSDNRYREMCPPGLCWGFDHTVTGAWDVAGVPNRDRDDLLSLLMTCRRAYVGDILLVYARRLLILR